MESLQLERYNPENAWHFRIFYVLKVAQRAKIQLKFYLLASKAKINFFQFFSKVAEWSNFFNKMSAYLHSTCFFIAYLTYSTIHPFIAHCDMIKVNLTNHTYFKCKSIGSITWLETQVNWKLELYLVQRSQVSNWISHDQALRVRVSFRAWSCGKY